MKSQVSTTTESYACRSLAAEDLRRGDFVSIVQEIVEFPSFWWDCDGHLLPPAEPVRLSCLSSDGGTPLKVKAICLPFVFVKNPSGQHRALNIRRHRLARLSREYAEQVWKAMRKPA